MVACTCNPSAVLMRLGDPWPASLFYAVSERPRDSKMNQGANAWGKLSKTDLWPPHIHACIPAHTWISHAPIRTEDAGEVFVLPTQVVWGAVRSCIQTGSAVYDMPVVQRLDGTNLTWPRDREAPTLWCLVFAVRNPIINQDMVSVLLGLMTDCMTGFTSRQEKQLWD